MRGVSFLFQDSESDRQSSLNVLVQISEVATLQVNIDIDCGGDMS